MAQLVMLKPQHLPDSFISTLYCQFSVLRTGYLLLETGRKGEQRCATFLQKTYQYSVEVVWSSVTDH